MWVNKRWLTKKAQIKKLLIWNVYSYKCTVRWIITKIITNVWCKIVILKIINNYGTFLALNLVQQAHSKHIPTHSCTHTGPCTHMYTLHNLQPYLGIKQIIKRGFNNWGNQTWAYCVSLPIPLVLYTGIL